MIVPRSCALHPESRSLRFLRAFLLGQMLLGSSMPSPGWRRCCQLCAQGWRLLAIQPWLPVRRFVVSVIANANANANASAKTNPNPKTIPDVMAGTKALQMASPASSLRLAWAGSRCLNDGVGRELGSCRLFRSPAP